MAKGSISISMSIPQGLYSMMERMSWYEKRDVVERAMKNALAPTLAFARSKAPRRFGWLQRSLGVKVTSYKESQIVVGIMGPRKDVVGRVTIGRKQYTWWPIKYAHLVEGGVAPHPMRTKSGGTAQHPGVPARPFIEPSVDEAGIFDRLCSDLSAALLQT